MQHCIAGTSSAENSPKCEENGDLQPKNQTWVGRPCSVAGPIKSFSNKLSFLENIKL